MKGRIFLITTGIVVASVVAYKICKHFRKTSSKDYKKELTSNNIVHYMPDVLTTEETNTPVATDVYKTREAVVHSVRERHSEAAKTMDKSLNTIFNDFENDIVIENNYAFGEISGDLDDLLK